MWIKASEWNIREVQSSALAEEGKQKKNKGKSLSCRVRAEESEVAGRRSRGGVGKASRREDDRLIKGAKAIGGGRANGPPQKIGKGKSGSLSLSLSFALFLSPALHFIYMAGRIDQSDWERGPWLRQANKDSKCLHCSHPSAS